MFLVTPRFPMYSKIFKYLQYCSTTKYFNFVWFLMEPLLSKLGCNGILKTFHRSQFFINFNNFNFFINFIMVQVGLLLFIH